jgi:hypothetical protein
MLFPYPFCVAGAGRKPPLDTLAGSTIVDAGEGEARGAGDVLAGSSETSGQSDRKAAATRPLAPTSAGVALEANLGSGRGLLDHRQPKLERPPGQYHSRQCSGALQQRGRSDRHGHRVPCGILASGRHREMLPRGASGKVVEGHAEQKPPILLHPRSCETLKRRRLRRFDTSREGRAERAEHRKLQICAHVLDVGASRMPSQRIEFSIARIQKPQQCAESAC